MNASLIVAGCLGLLGAAIHGVAGEVLVVRKLAAELLPRTPFGGARATQAMIHTTWHLTTFAFVAVGVALLLAGSVLDGEAARAVALAAAVAATGFAALVGGIGAAYAMTARSLWRHPAPALLTATALFAWWGAL